jgi:Superinfection immunity protein
MPLDAPQPHGAKLNSLKEASVMMLPAIFFIPFFGFGFVFYFLPSIVAFARSKRDMLSIFLLNLFLGWTLIGWIVALVWAAKVDHPLPAR